LISQLIPSLSALSIFSCPWLTLINKPECICPISCLKNLSLTSDPPLATTPLLCYLSIQFFLNSIAQSHSLSTSITQALFPNFTKTDLASWLKTFLPNMSGLCPHLDLPFGHTWNKWLLTSSFLKHLMFVAHVKPHLLSFSFSLIVCSFSASFAASFTSFPPLKDGWLSPGLSTGNSFSSLYSCFSVWHHHALGCSDGKHCKPHLSSRFASHSILHPSTNPFQIWPLALTSPLLAMVGLARLLQSSPNKLPCFLSGLPCNWCSTHSFHQCSHSFPSYSEWKPNLPPQSAALDMICLTSAPTTSPLQPHSNPLLPVGPTPTIAWNTLSHLRLMYGFLLHFL
jgi:hypothetical protein